MPYRVIISQTGRNNMRQQPHLFNEETKLFRNMKQVKSYIKDTYGKARGKPMFIDTKSGKPKQIGRVYGFWNSDWSHAPVEKWFQQDWVSVRKEKYSYPSLSRRR